MGNFYVNLRNMNLIRIDPPNNLDINLITSLNYSTHIWLFINLFLNKYIDWVINMLIETLII